MGGGILQLSVPITNCLIGLEKMHYNLFKITLSTERNGCPPEEENVHTEFKF